MTHQGLTGNIINPPDFLQKSGIMEFRPVKGARYLIWDLPPMLYI